MDKNTLEITEQPEGLGFISMRELVNQTLRKNFGSKLKSGYVPSGFKELDEKLGGFKNGLLYTIAVKPGMGKTAFLLSLSNNMAIKDDYSVAIFSSERSNIKITNRIIESETGMSLQKLQSNAFKDSEKDHMLSVLSNIAKAKIFIDDTPALPVESLALKAKQLKMVHAVDIIIIDYLELLTSSAKESMDRPVHLSGIMRKLRDMAQEVNLPVLLFTQITGPVNGMKPESGHSLSSFPAFLNEMSDVLMFLQRNDAGIRPLKAGKSAVELMIVNKNAGNEETMVPLHFIGSIAKFADFS